MINQTPREYVQSIVGIISDKALFNYLKNDCEIISLDAFKLFPDEKSFNGYRFRHKTNGWDTYLIVLFNGKYLELQYCQMYKCNEDGLVENIEMNYTHIIDTMIFVQPVLKQKEAMIPVMQNVVEYEPVKGD